MAARKTDSQGRPQDREDEREAEWRWGNTEAFAQSQRKSTQYTEEDWARHQQEQDAIYDAAADSYVAISGPVNSARLPAFHQLDLRVDKTWIKDLWRFTLYLDVQNAYNNLQNVEFQNYSYNFQQNQPITGLPILPSLGLKAEF